MDGETSPPNTQASPQSFSQLQLKIMALRKLIIMDCERNHSMGSLMDAVGGCRSSVEECWQLKPEALGPGGATFLSLLLSFQRSTDNNGTRLSFIRRSLSIFGLWGSPIHRAPHAVIMLAIHYVQQLHAAIIQYIPHWESYCLPVNADK